MEIDFLIFWLIVFLAAFWCGTISNRLQEIKETLEAED